MAQNEMEPLTLWDVRVLGIAVFIAVVCSFGIDMHLPSLPSMVTAFHSTTGMLQSSITIYLLGMLIAQLVYGPLSDKLGRRNVFLLGLGVAIIGSIICSVAATIDVFLAGRLVQGLGAAVGMSLGRSVVVDIMSGPKMVRYGSYISVFITIGTMVAPMIGGYLQHWFGWQANFIVLTLLFVACFIITFAALPETLTTQNALAFHPKHLLNNYWTMLKSPTFLGFTLCSGLGMAAVMVYTAVSPFLFQIQYHLSPVFYGWLGTIIGVAGIVGRLLNGAVANRLGMHKGIVTGMSIFLIMGAVLLMGQLLGALTVVSVLVLICLSTLGQGFIFANAMTGAMSPFRHLGGTVGALYGSMQYWISFFVVSLISLSHAHGVMVLGVSYVVLAAVGLVGFTCSRKLALKDQEC